MKSLAEAIEANRTRQAELREKRARGFTTTIEPGCIFVGPPDDVIVEEALRRLAASKEGGTP